MEHNDLRKRYGRFINTHATQGASLVWLPFNIARIKLILL